MENVSSPVSSLAHTSSSARLMETQSSRNEDWNIVQRVVMSLFQQKSIGGPIDFHELNQKLLNLMKTEIAPFLGAYYQEQLLKRGMIVMREAVREETGQSLLDRLETVWKRFFGSILPSLQMIFFPLTSSQTSSGMSIRNMSLVGFRDIIIMKLPVHEALQTPGVVASPVIQQMLLVMWSVREKDHPTETYLQLEEIVACAVSPFLRTAYTLKKIQDDRARKSPKIEKAVGAGTSSTLPRNMSGSTMVSSHLVLSHEAETDSTKARGKTFSHSSDRGSFPPAADQPSLRRKGQVSKRQGRPSSTKSSHNVNASVDLGTLQEQSTQAATGDSGQPDATVTGEPAAQEEDSCSSGESRETCIPTIAVMPSSVQSTGSNSSGPEPKTPISAAGQNSPDLGSMGEASIV